MRSCHPSTPIIAWSIMALSQYSLCRTRIHILYSKTSVCSLEFLGVLKFNYMTVLIRAQHPNNRKRQFHYTPHAQTTPGMLSSSWSAICLRKTILNCSLSRRDHQTRAVAKLGSRAISNRGRTTKGRHIAFKYAKGQPMNDEIDLLSVVPGGRGWSSG